MEDSDNHILLEKLLETLEIYIFYNVFAVNIVRYEFDGVSELDYDGKLSPIVEVKGVPM